MTRTSQLLMFTNDCCNLGRTGWIRESEEDLKISRAVLSIWTVVPIGPSTRGAQKFTPMMSLIFLISSLNKPILIIVMMLLRRFGLPWQVWRSVVLNQEQISKLIIPTNNGIYIVRLIEHWKFRIFIWGGAPSSIIVIVLLALLAQTAKNNILGVFL